MTHHQRIHPDPSASRSLTTAATLLALLGIFLGGAYAIAPSLMRLKAELSEGGVSVEMEVRQGPLIVPVPQQTPALTP
jgi:hypothetical protein